MLPADAAILTSTRFTRTYFTNSMTTGDRSHRAFTLITNGAFIILGYISRSYSELLETAICYFNFALCFQNMLALYFFFSSCLRLF